MGVRYEADRVQEFPMINGVSRHFHQDSDVKLPENKIYLIICSETSPEQRHEYFLENAARRLRFRRYVASFERRQQDILARGARTTSV